MNKNKKWVGLGVLVLLLIVATVILRSKIWATKNSISESGLFAEINNDELVYVDEDGKESNDNEISSTVSPESLLIEKTLKDIVNVMEGNKVEYSEIYTDDAVDALNSVVDNSNLVNLSELFPEAWKDADQPTMGEYTLEPQRVKDGFRYSKQVNEDGTSKEVKEDIKDLIDSNIETIDGVDYIDVEKIKRAENDNSYGYLQYYCERLVDFAELDDLQEVRKTNPGGKYTWIPDSENDWKVKNNEYNIKFTNFADNSVIATASIFVEDGKVSYISLNGFDSSRVHLSVDEDEESEDEESEDEESEDEETEGEEGEIDESIYE